MTSRAQAGLIALAIVSLGSAPAAFAHQQTASYGHVAWDTSGAVTWSLRVRRLDADAALGAAAQGAQGRRTIEAYLAAGLRVTDGALRCAVQTHHLEDEAGAPEPTLVFTQTFRCPPNAGPLQLRYDLLFETDRLHQSFTRLSGPQGASGVPASAVFRDGAREVLLESGGRPGSSSVWASARLYLGLGVIHILTGYDHLAFLLGLLLAAGLRERTQPGHVAVPALPGQALRQVVPIVSAFTIAHSVTLVTQALRPGLLGVRWVEPAIALSVAFVGFDNLRPRTARFRLPLVFGFGLIHGLGFASVLREIGLPPRGLLLSLLAFNLGVELGQLSVLLVVLPAILLAARRAPQGYERWGLRLGSGIIAAFGTVWLCLRLAAG